MKKICFITRNNSEIFDDFANKVAAETGVKTEIWNPEDLAFSLDGENTHVTNYKTGEDLADFARVFVLSTPEHEKNHIFSALGCYARKRGIDMYDDEFANLSGKLWEMFCFWEADIPVPKTAFGPINFMTESLERMGGVGVLKATHASKGKDNYLVRSTDDLRRILSENPEKTYILQEFIPNDGDFRVLVFNYEPALVLYRHRTNESTEHRNNTSVGGLADVVTLDDMDSNVLKMCVKAAQTMHVKLAGSDVIQNKETGEYFILEVNRTPQIASGGLVEEKAKAIAKLI